MSIKRIKTAFFAKHNYFNARRYGYFGAREDIAAGFDFGFTKGFMS